MLVASAQMSCRQCEGWHTFEQRRPIITFMTFCIEVVSEGLGNGFCRNFVVKDVESFKFGAKDEKLIKLTNLSKF